MLLGELLPLRRVTEHRLEALLREPVDAVVEDRLLAGDTQGLLDLDLHWQTVGVPTRAPIDVVAAHRAVARKEVLDDARQNVPVVGRPLAVGGPS